MHVPGLLPRLLHCVEWNDHRDVAEVGLLLHMWPKLPAVRALELLDYAYADQAVRKYAVQCLQDMRYEIIKKYDCMIKLFKLLCFAFIYKIHFYMILIRKQYKFRDLQNFVFNIL